MRRRQPDAWKLHGARKVLQIVQSFLKTWRYSNFVFEYEEYVSLYYTLLKRGARLFLYYFVYNLTIAVASNFTFHMNSCWRSQSFIKKLHAHSGLFFTSFRWFKLHFIIYDGTNSLPYKRTKEPVRINRRFA